MNQTQRLLEFVEAYTVPYCPVCHFGLSPLGGPCVRCMFRPDAAITLLPSVPAVHPRLARRASLLVMRTPMGLREVTTRFWLHQLDEPVAVATAALAVWLQTTQGLPLDVRVQWQRQHGAQVALRMLAAKDHARFVRYCAR